jgi:hypothetical protein
MDKQTLENELVKINELIIFQNKVINVTNKTNITLSIISIVTICVITYCVASDGNISSLDMLSIGFLVGNSIITIKKFLTSNKENKSTLDNFIKYRDFYIERLEEEYKNK